MILVLNLGLKSIRAIVFDEKGKKLKSASKPVHTLLRGNYVEQDPEEWWQKGIEVIQEATLERDIRKSIDYITVTSSSSCLVPVNSAGRSVMNSMMVSDKRAIPQAQRLREIPAFQTLSKANQNFVAEPSLMIPKMMWLKEHDPELFEQTKYFLSSNDFLVYRISGEMCTDVLNAEKFYYDLKTKSYPAALLKAVDIEEATLPPVKQIGFDVGDATAHFKSLTALPENKSIKVILSTYDAICAFFGSGVSQEGEGCDVSGTVSSLRVLSRNKPDMVNTSIFTQYEPTNNIYIVGGSNNLGGGLIEWTKQCFYQDEKYPYEVMEKEATESLPGARGIIFLPYLLGERAPLWNNNARGAFFGLERFHNRKDFVRAIFESAGFSIRHLMEAIESQNIQVSGVRFSGGLSRIKFIAQLKADILGKEVHLIDEFETTSLGAFFLTGLSTGLFTSAEETAGMVKVREVILPDPERHKIYSQFYEMYKEMYETLKPMYEKRQALMSDAYFQKIERIENL